MYHVIVLRRPCHSSGGQALDSHRGDLDSSPGQVMWDLWLTKWHWGRFSPSISVSPANLNSTNYSTITIWSSYNRPVVASVPSGLSLHPAKNNNNKKCASTIMSSRDQYSFNLITNVDAFLLFYKRLMMVVKDGNT
jgi:hypothetical protein